MKVAFQVAYTEIDARQKPVPVACLLFLLVLYNLEKPLYSLFSSRLNPLSPGLLFPLTQQCFQMLSLRSQKNFALIAQLFVCIAKTIYLWSLGQNEFIRPLQYRKLSMWALKLTVIARYIELCSSQCSACLLLACCNGIFHNSLILISLLQSVRLPTHGHWQQQIILRVFF